LGIPRPQVIGHLHMLWYWAMDYAQDGRIGGFDALDVAIAADWEGEPDAFIDGLKQAGFIDRDGKLHDWEDYAGKYFKRREQNMERQQRFRETRASKPDSPVSRVSNALLTDVSRVSNASRVEKSREENISEPTVPLVRSRGPYTDEFEQFWDDYPKVTNNSKIKAFKAWDRLTKERRQLARDALPAFIASDGWRRGFAPHTTTYLNGRLWESAPAQSPNGAERPTLRVMTDAERTAFEAERRARLALLDGDA
jgi:hypothetical protein